MLKIDLKVGESVRIGGAVVTLEEKSGKAAKLSIQADRSILVERVQQRTAASIAAANGINGKE